MTTALCAKGQGNFFCRRQAPTKSVILIMGRENYRTLCQRARPKLKRVILIMTRFLKEVRPDFGLF
jgi:hypothetical protein